MIVQSSLREYEPNVFHPLSDIVWYGESVGNRHEQARQFFDEVLGPVTGGMTTGHPANVEVNVTRFHGLTKKTRYFV
jgi:hypothetical protein